MTENSLNIVSYSRRLVPFYIVSIILHVVFLGSYILFDSLNTKDGSLNKTFFRAGTDERIQERTGGSGDAGSRVNPEWRKIYSIEYIPVLLIENPISSSHMIIPPVKVKPPDDKAAKNTSTNAILDKSNIANSENRDVADSGNILTVSDSSFHGNGGSGSGSGDYGTGAGGSGSGNGSNGTGTGGSGYGKGDSSRGNPPTENKSIPEENPDKSPNLTFIKANYQKAILAKIDNAKLYPSAARRSNKEGSVVVEFTVIKNGSVSGVEVQKSASFAPFNDSALKAIESAQPFDPIPDELQLTQMTVSVTIDFTIL